MKYISTEQQQSSLTRALRSDSPCQPFFSTAGGKINHILLRQNLVAKESHVSFLYISRMIDSVDRILSMPNKL